MYFNPKKADSIYNFLSHVYICSSCLHQSFTNDCCVVHNEPRDMESGCWNVFLVQNCQLQHLMDILYAVKFTPGINCGQL